MPLPPNRMDYLPMIDRPIIKWPNDAKIAFWVAPNVEHYEYLPPLDGVRNPWPRTPLPGSDANSSTIPSGRTPRSAPKRTIASATGCSERASKLTI